MTPENVRYACELLDRRTQLMKLAHNERVRARRGKYDAKVMLHDTLREIQLCEDYLDLMGVVLPPKRERNTD